MDNKIPQTEDILKEIFSTGNTAMMLETEVFEIEPDITVVSCAGRFTFVANRIRQFRHGPVILGRAVATLPDGSRPTSAGQRQSTSLDRLPSSGGRH